MEETGGERTLSLGILQALLDFSPKDIRPKGRAPFTAKRYGKVFIYHNGADSYYRVRGFRAKMLLQEAR